MKKKNSKLGFYQVAMKVNLSHSAINLLENYYPMFLYSVENASKEWDLYLSP